MNETVVDVSQNGLHERYTFNKVAKQATSSVLYRQKDAVLLATVVVDTTTVEEDFLPLTVQYLERSYAAAKIPGGFVKRETKPGDFETLTSRIIDRSIRPLFPDGFFYPVSVTLLVLSSDEEVDKQVAALHAANAVLSVSNLPIEASIAATRIGRVDGEFVVNPDLSVQEESSIDLLVVGKGSDVMMIEMRSLGSEDTHSQSDSQNMYPSQALSQETLLEAISLASTVIEESSKGYMEAFSSVKAPSKTYALTPTTYDASLYEMIATKYHVDMQEAIVSMAKSERSENIETLAHTIVQKLESEGKAYEVSEVMRALEAYKKFVVRQMVLAQKSRADGRALDEIRPISIETNILPSVHGSALFTRGETQVLATATIGDKKDAQSYELITQKGSLNENFMVHYNFPGFSVGETKPIGAPNRRELGHGNLAKRALEPLLALSDDTTVRVVAEVLESNGSSSMATVCSGALALKAAQMPLKELVAGIAMGLVYEEGEYEILSDIMGLEDFTGDMDFKVAGTSEGITALQMDTKLEGLPFKVIEEALGQAYHGLLHILELMESASQQIQRSKALPRVIAFEIDPSKIGDVIGKGGVTIREIIDTHDVSIDLERQSGTVKITGKTVESLEAAQEDVMRIANTPTPKQMEYVIGERYEGVVKKIVDFGLFVEMPDGFDALLHISKVAKERVNNLTERYSAGDVITVIVMEQNGKKVELATPEFLG
jgi:polyribonucleotide nucleotidyltransferase